MEQKWRSCEAPHALPVVIRVSRQVSRTGRDNRDSRSRSAKKTPNSPFRLAEALCNLDPHIELELPVGQRLGNAVVSPTQEARVLELLAIGVLDKELAHVFVDVILVQSLVRSIQLPLEADYYSPGTLTVWREICQGDT